MQQEEDDELNDGIIAFSRALHMLPVSEARPSGWLSDSAESAGSLWHEVLLRLFSGQ